MKDEVCTQCGDDFEDKDGRFVARVIDADRTFCNRCADRYYNGPSDQEQEDAAESADYAKQRYEDDLVFAGRGHLIGK